MIRNRVLLLIVAFTALILLVIGGFWLVRGQSDDQFAQCRQGVVAGGLDQFGGAFELTDQDGHKVTDQDVFSKPALLYFGYTFCPDVCPIDTSRNAMAADLLQDEGYDIRPVFITVDPKRDTPEVLRDFAEVIHPDMIGLTGSSDEIAAVNKLWRNYYQSHDDGTDPYYLVDHMTNTYLVLPQHGTVEFLTRDLSAEDMAERVGCFLDAAS